PITASSDTYSLSLHDALPICQKDSNGVLFTVTPSISSLLPTFGSAGMSVTVDGSTFGSSVGSITFNGTVAAAIAWSTTEIVAIVDRKSTRLNSSHLGISYAVF